MKDSEGNKVKDENGKDKRSDVSDGWTYTFAEFGTAKVVKVVIPKLYELELLQPYQVSGYGYDIRNAGMVFIDSEGELNSTKSRDKMSRTSLSWTALDKCVRDYSGALLLSR